MSDEKRIAELTALLRETQRGFRAEGDPQTELEAPQFVDLMKRVDAALTTAEAEKPEGDCTCNWVALYGGRCTSCEKPKAPVAERAEAEKEGGSK